MQMQINRIYNDKNYTSVQVLRNEIFAQTGRIFGNEPDTDEERKTFWEELGVIYEVIPPTQEEINTQIQQQMTNKIQQYLDTTAQKLGYDSCLSVCSYVDTGVTKFDEEGEAFRKWRSAVWAKGYEILDAVKNGSCSIPTEEELFLELPALELNRAELNE